MAILWLDESSGPTMDALTRGYEIGNPKAGDDTHLIDHTWLALVATAGLTMIEYTFVRQPENWQARTFVEGQYVDSTADFSAFESILSNHAGSTAIVQVEHTPGRMKSDEYAEGESVTLLGTFPIQASLNNLYSYLSSFDEIIYGFTEEKTALEGKVSTLESTVSNLTSRLEAIENPD